MKKLQTEKIQKFYSIFVSIFIIALGIAFVCVCADIYYSGKGSNEIFSREIVANRLQLLAIPCIIILGLIVAGFVFPLQKTLVKKTEKDKLKLLATKLPQSGVGEEYALAKRKYINLEKTKLIVFCAKMCILLACVIASLCYLLNTTNFLGSDITKEIFALTKNVLRWVLVAFAVLIACGIFDSIVSKKQINELKTLIKFGDGVVQKDEPNFYAIKLKQMLSSKITINVIRAVVLVVGVTFVVLGVLNGGANDVMIKAINICTECIGLG